MAGYDCVERAIAHADDPSNHGNGYELLVTLKSGAQIQGAVADVILVSETLKLQRRPNGGFGSLQDVFIDCTEVAAAEIIW